MARRRTFIVQNPGSDRSIKMISRIFTLYGLRPICLYSSAGRRSAMERRHDLLRPEMVEDRLVGTDLAAVAATVRERFDVVCVIPHLEELVVAAGELCELLGIDWNSPEVLAPFRDKHALKVVLEAAGVRVPAYRAFAPDDALDPATTPTRFVLKPNDGSGNRGVRVFRHDEVAAARAHLRTHREPNWLLEEFIDGPEYSVNGQVRTDGEVVVYGIMQYRRCRVGTCDTVYHSEFQCPSTHPHFATLVQYATEVIAATGLRRSPFHLEIKIDERGPCVIDLAARFGGGGLMYGISRSHRTAADLFTIAAHDYVGPNDIPVGPIDWAWHDANRVMYVFGISHTSCTIHQLTGHEAIEARPEFVRWVLTPSVGMRLEPTETLFSAPYIAELRVPPTETERDALIDLVHQTVRWNTTRSLVQQARVRARRAAWTTRASVRAAVIDGRRRVLDP